MKYGVSASKARLYPKGGVASSRSKVYHMSDSREGHQAACHSRVFLIVTDTEDRIVQGFPNRRICKRCLRAKNPDMEVFFVA